MEKPTESDIVTDTGIYNDTGIQNDTGIDIRTDTGIDNDNTITNDKKHDDSTTDKRIILVIAMISGVILALLGIGLLAEFGLLDDLLGTATSGEDIILSSSHSEDHNTSSSSSSNNIIMDIVRPDIILEKPWMTKRVLRAIIIGILAAVLLSMAAVLVYLLVSANMAVVEDNESPVEPVRPQEVDQSMTARVYRWCQDAMPERVDFCASLCCGFLLSMLLATLYPSPSSRLTFSLIIVAIMALSAFAVLFLPWTFLMATATIVLLSVLVRWSTWPRTGAPLTSPLGRTLSTMSDSPHLVNLVVAAMVAVYAVVTWSRLDVSGERGGWEKWVMGPMLAAAVMAAVGQTLVGRPSPSYGLQWVYLAVGVVSAIFMAGVCDTWILLEVVATVLVWLYCKHFIAH